MKFRLGTVLCSLIAVTAVALTAVGVAAQGVRLELGNPDTSDFPIIRINVQTAGANNTPLNDAELANLRLRENGVPISNFDLRFVPVGADLLFVVDADATLLFADVEETTRLEVLKESIARYTSRFMNPNGQDRVSILVPNRTNTGGEFLVKDATTPAEVVAALDGYNPTSLPEEGPINQQVLEAIDHAAGIQVDGRYQAILLLSEARRLSQLLDYPTITAEAQANGIPIFVTILGPEASLEDIGNSSALAEPTGGFYVHAPRAERIDPIYLRWQQGSNLPQISYRSLLTKSGRYPVSVNLGQVSAATELDLTLSTPEVTIALERSVIRRAGTAVDTPVADLQPAVQPVPVQIIWPDEISRQLTDLTFRVNNVPQPQLTLPQPDAEGMILLEWNIQNEDVGVYDLEVQIEDELGFVITAEPLIVTISVDRPAPPTPTPAPTPTAQAVEQVAELAAIPRSDLLMLLAGLGLVGLVLVMVRGFRRYRGGVEAGRVRAEQRETLQRIQEGKVAALPDEVAPEPRELAIILLDEALSEKGVIPLTGDSITVGREAEVAEVVLDNAAVSPLHARIRERNGRYWLYDEGSERGTFLNYQQLGLSPRSLADGDLVQFGQVMVRIRLKTAGELAEMAEKAAQEAETADAEDEAAAEETAAGAANADAADAADPATPVDDEGGGDDEPT